MSAKSERKKTVYEEKKGSAAVPEPPKPKVPHFTVESAFPLLSSDAVVLIDGHKVVPLLEETGFLKFSDKNGGSAYLVDSTTYRS